LIPAAEPLAALFGSGALDDGIGFPEIDQT